MSYVTNTYDFHAAIQIQFNEDVFVTGSTPITASMSKVDTNLGYFLCESFEANGEIYMKVTEYKEQNITQLQLCAPFPGMNIPWTQEKKDEFSKSLALYEDGALNFIDQQSKLEDEWIVWLGGESLPTDIRSIRQIKFRSQEIHNVCGGDGLFWKHTGNSYDIIAYKMESES